MTPAWRSLAPAAKAWPFEQARLLLERVEKRGASGPVIFETGYGPSGLPHIGTFGEVVRTTMVRHAFTTLTGGAIETRLICVSDDMDGMRKVPDTVPSDKRAELEAYLQRPLTAVPNPFETDDASFAHHNNAMLRRFLDRFKDEFGLEYEFLSATELYRSGRFDPMLQRALERFEAIMDVMLPTLGPERRATYSPFLPISPKTGRVLYVPMIARDAAAGTITFKDEDGSEVTSPVTGGATKLQWKPDFGMRWAALGVDFEMYGKDHQTNGPIYSKICRILGVEPPVQYCYELFLDKDGEKISKSKGNGIAVEDWLRYATPESLALYMFQKPRQAKRLHFDVIPKAVDEYSSFLEAYSREEPDRQLENPVWHIHAGAPPSETLPVSFALMLNLVSAANASSKDVLWGFLKRYAPGASPQANPGLDRLAGYALNYYEDFVAPAKRFRAPSDQERAAMHDLRDALAGLPQGTADAGALQDLTFEVGKRHEFENLRDWFKALYEVLLGQEQGPRFGGFVALFGVAETVALIDGALARPA
jgi:lysyl-tRNA synthetase, class I